MEMIEDIEMNPTQQKSLNSEFFLWRYEFLKYNCGIAHEEFKSA